MTPVNANINDMAECLRNLINNMEINITEFDIYLATGRLQVFILKRLLEKLGYELEPGSKGDSDRHGREFFITRGADKISINFESIPSSNHRFEILCNDAGQPSRDNVDYFVLMTYKYIYFVRPDKIQIENPQVKTNSKNEKFFEYDVARARDKADQIIQISELVIF